MDLESDVEECMRRHRIKHGTGSWDLYYKALRIAKREIKKCDLCRLKELVQEWVDPRDSE